LEANRGRIDKSIPSSREERTQKNYKTGNILGVLPKEDQAQRERVIVSLDRRTDRNLASRKLSGSDLGRMTAREKGARWQSKKKNFFRKLAGHRQRRANELDRETDQQERKPEGNARRTRVKGKGRNEKRLQQVRKRRGSCG